MRLFFATGNRHKYQELHTLLAPLPIVLQHHKPLVSPAETGCSFRENAAIKALAARDQINDFVHATIAEDSGLEIDAIDGKPGINSARYTDSHDDTANMARVLAQLAGIPPLKRIARFRCVFCLSTTVGLFFAEGLCPGWIALHPQGHLGFGYDPIFIPNFKELSLPEDLVSTYAGRTLGNIPLSIKNQISHRNKALQQLLPLLTSTH